MCDPALVKHVAAQLDQVAKIWSEAFQVPEAVQTLVRSIARRFVSAVSELPTPAASVTRFQRRRVIVLRTVKTLALQGEAERELLQSLGAGNEKPANMTKRQCEVIEFDR